MLQCDTHSITYNVFLLKMFNINIMKPPDVILAYGKQEIE